MAQQLSEQQNHKLERKKQKSTVFIGIQKLSKSHAISKYDAAPWKNLN